MGRGLVWAVTTALTLQIIGAAQLQCPRDPNCVCSVILDIELSCNIDGHSVKINLLPDIYINIKCENTTDLDYGKLPRCVNDSVNFKTVSFKDCPLPSTSFKDVLTTIGVSKSMALTFQNGKNLTRHFDRKQFAGLQDLKKLLLSINGVTHLPDDLFADINELTWLNIRSNGINLSVELLKPLEKLETLEISHNHMTNISSNLFSHLSFLRKLSLWQSNVTWFSKDLFNGVEVLEELDLSSNELNKLPATIFKPLRRLKKLTLYSNKFSSLPQNLFRDNDGIETIVILNNDDKLKQLPGKMFGNLGKLTQIVIQRCGLEYIPKDVFTNSSLITNISLAYNDIRRLPEPVFNDQINLLELDLSHNKLVCLAPKLFSSLVRLEKLNLCWNSIFYMNRLTYDPLLSLIYLNMDHNNLTVIDDDIFTNNEQRMSISVAYNRLKYVIDFTSICAKFSPFNSIYNMSLLNVSHNELTSTYPDWWIRGHEVLDISHNQIEYLLLNFWCQCDPYHLLKRILTYFQDAYISPTNKRVLINRPVKYIYMSNNPIQCSVCNFEFLDYVLRNSLNQADVLDSIPCWKWSIIIFRENYIQLIIVVGITSIFFVACFCMDAICSFYYWCKTTIREIRRAVRCSVIYCRKILTMHSKKIFEAMFRRAKKTNDYRLLVRTCDEDTKFFLEVFAPAMESYHLNNFIHEVSPIVTKQNDTVKVYVPLCCVKEDKKQITIVLFSPNYLTSTYGHVDIKNIHTEMLKAENTIYVFADIGPDNSIYAFLKDQRDVAASVVYNEPNFMDKFVGILNQFAVDIDTVKEDIKADNDKTKIICESKVFNELKINDLNTPTHSQV